MNAIPLPGTHRLARAARRTQLVKAALAATLVALVLLAAATARHHGVRQPSSLPARSGDMIVLDLSASISSDTFSRIGETLRKLVAQGGRYGLVVFSNDAYEALPPGSPASALRPLIRYFSVPAQTSPGAAVGLPTNPWTNSFSYGTEISTGLNLAHRILVSDHLTRSRVVLISDLDDDPEDLQRLNGVVSAEYGTGRGHTPLRVVALNAAPGDEAFFQHIANTAVTNGPATPAKPSPPPVVPPSTIPSGLLAAIAAVFVALVAYVFWTARLRWDTSQVEAPK
jgi:hypothetical protein